ncbi:MAG TPA: flippase [Terriglobales bacterium]|nr:flippase [Terriglobales bacterium]
MNPPLATPELGQSPDQSGVFRQHMGKVSRHSGVFFAGTIFNAAAGYLFKVYLARVLGAKALGIYALGMTLVGFLSVFNVLGLHRTALRFVAEYSATGKAGLLRGFLVRSMAVLAAANIVLVAVMLLAGPWVAVRLYHTPELRSYIGLFAVIMLLGVFTTFLGQVLGGYQEVARRTVIINFVGTPAAIAVTVLLVALGKGLWGYIFAQIVSAVLVLGLSAALVWRLTPKPEHGPSVSFPPLEKKVISFSAAVLGLSFLEFIVSGTDRVVIGYYLSARELGIYAVAGAIVVFVPIVLRSINQIFAPIISDLYARGQLAMLNRMFQTLTKWVVGLTVPLAAVLIVFAKPLMRIFGPDFEKGWPILVVGTVGQLINCGVGSVGTLLLMSGQQKRLVWIQAATAATMVVLSLALVPRWGITGAAVATAVTLGMANLWFLIEVRRRLGLFPYNRQWWRLVLPLGGSCATLLVLRKLVVLRPQWAVAGLGLIAAYLVFAGIALAFGLDADDRIIAGAIWSRITSILPKAEASI